MKMSSEKSRIFRVMVSFLIVTNFVSSLPFSMMDRAFAQESSKAHQETTGIIPSAGSASQAMAANTAAQNKVDQMNVAATLAAKPSAPVVPTTPAHPTDPVKEEEHQALMALVADQNATLIIDSDTNWSELSIKDGEKIVIKEGMTVIVDQVSKVKVQWIRVDGALKFATDKDTSLKVVTLVVNVKGYLEVGTAENRIQSGKKAEIIIADRGARDDAARVLDPMDLTGGLISHGKVRMYGELYASQSPLASAPKAGDKQLILTAPATGWKTGDALVLAGSDPDSNQDEELIISHISADGTIISFENLANSKNKTALKFNHDGEIPLANVTRNAVIYSENTADISRRGHVMFMHSPNVVIDSAGFYGLGRTDARKAVTDPALDANGNLIPGSDSNTRGRYAVHFHVRTGADSTKTPALIQNSAVVDSPKFGIVNHGGNVRIENNVTYDIDGSHIFLENGSEIGVVKENLMIRARGNEFLWTDPANAKAQPVKIRDGQESRKDIFDFGFRGNGLWAQGGGVDVTDNFAVGMADSAYIFFTQSIKEGGKTISFLVSNLKAGAYKDSLIARNIKTIDVGDVPFYFARNKATGSAAGFESKFHLLGVRDVNARSLVEDSVFWNNRAGSINHYTNQLTFRNNRFIADVNNPRGSAFIRNHVTRSLNYENLHVEGFRNGIAIPINGDNKVSGGYLNNVFNIQITTTNMVGRKVTIDTAGLKFGVLSAAALKKAGVDQQLDVVLTSNFRPKDGDISKNFENDVISAAGDDVRVAGKQLFYEEQAADYVPFKKVLDAAGNVISDTLTGSDLDNLSNQELWDKYRLAIGGVIAPANAVKDPRIKGLIGDAAAYDKPLTLASARFTPLTGYTLRVKDSKGKLITQTATLKENSWNIVRMLADDVLRSVLIYQDSTAPTFVPDPVSMKPENLIINPADLPFGFKVVGRQVDMIGNLVTTKPVMVVYQLAKNPLKPGPNEFVVSADGQSLLINVQVTDRAGNKAFYPITVRITKDAPIRGRNVDAFGQPSFMKNLPARRVSMILKFLFGVKGLGPIRMF